MDGANEHFDHHQDIANMTVLAVANWKIAVQEAVNAVVTEGLRLSLEERTPERLLSIMKTQWFQKVSPLWFHTDTSYYLWLASIAGHLLSQLDEEKGKVLGLSQYRQFPKALSHSHFTFPTVAEPHIWKAYVMGKDPLMMRSLARLMGEMGRCSSQPLPENIGIYSVELGEWYDFRVYERNVY